MVANEQVLVEVERAPLAREEVLDEGLAELKSVVMRLDRAVIFGDHAHRQVFVEVRSTDCYTNNLRTKNSELS